MAFTVHTVSAETLKDSIASLGLEGAFDASMVGILNQNILAVRIVAQDFQRRAGLVLALSTTVDATGATNLTAPYRLMSFIGRSAQEAEDQGTAYRAANPGFFFAAPYLQHMPQLSVGNRPYVLLQFYCEDAVGGPQNWKVEGGTGTGGAGDLYTNITPMPVTVGGHVAGSTFNNQTMQQMWTGLLYPYQAPTFSAFTISGQSSPREVGYPIPAAVTFTWATTNSANVAANTISIQNLTDGLLLAAGLANDGSEAVVMPGVVNLFTAGSKTFRITGTNTQASAFTRDATFSWHWRGYYGASSSVTLSEAQIEALAGTALVTGLAGSYSMAAGGYKFICLSDALGGQINTVKDSLTLLDVPMATAADDAAYSNIDGGGYSYALVSVTNAYGIVSNYRVYRTKNILGAAITLIVT